MESNFNYLTSLKNWLRCNYARIKLASPLNQYPLQKGEQIHSFFIIGSGRCGTTLLRRILFAHPDVCIPPETYVLHKCIHHFLIYNNMPWDQLVSLILSTLEYHPKYSGINISLRPLTNELYNTSKKDRSLAYILDRFYHYYAEKNKLSCVIWGDKTPKNTYHLELINRVFPQAKYIHLVRHGVDVVDSYLRAGLRQDLDYTAKKWKKAVQLAQSFGAMHPNRYIELRYENLVQDPGIWTKEICNFLGIEYIEDLVHKSQDVTDKMGDVQKYDHLSSVEKAVTTERIGIGKDSLSKNQLDRLYVIIGDTLDELGYER